MNERVVELLKLCLTAKSKGVFIWFSYSPHIDGINIYAYQEGWETIPLDEKPDKEFDLYIYLNWEDAEKRLVEAEQAVKDLIKERGETE